MLDRTVLRSNWDAVAALALSGAAVGLTAADQGGYFAPAWGWASFGLLLATALVLAFRDGAEISQLAVLMIAGFAAILVWTALSATWSESTPRTVEEVERTLVYFAAAAATAAIVPARRVAYLFGGLLGAVVAVAAYTLAAPAHSTLPGHGLIGPVGYWNALGILVSIAIILAVGFATARHSRLVRLAGAASIPVLATTLYLTKSRGAFGALIGGLFVFAFLHPALRQRRRQTAAAVVLALVLVALAAGVAIAGSPGALLGKTYSAFRGPAAPHGRPNETFLTFSGNNRSEYWRVALKEYRAHPWSGSGAGTFVLYWERYRNTIYGARDAHSLYLQTLAELGPLGLAILVATLALPFLALRGGRRDAIFAAGAGAYAAFLIHAAIDWDWQLPAVTLAGVFCGVGTAIAGPAAPMAVTAARRWAALALLAVLASFAAVAYRGNSADVAAARAAARGDHARAERLARRAASWLPWASEPWRVRAEAQLGAGDTAGARASLRTALQKDPHNWKLWYDLALATRGRTRRQAIDEAARLNRYSLEVLAFPRR